MAHRVLRQALGSDGDAILWLWEAHNSVNARLSTEGGGDPRHPKQLFPSMRRCPYCYHLTTTNSETGGNNILSSHDMDNMSPDFNNTVFLPGESLLHVGEEKEAEQPHPQLPRSVIRARQLKGLEHDYTWNRTAVLLYLWNFYRVDQRHGNGTNPGMELGHHRTRPSTLEILHAAWPRRSLKDHYRDMGWRQGRGLGSGSSGEGVCLEPLLLCAVGVAVLAVWLYRKRKCKRLLRLH